ncbi:MAG: T9SS type A sorting domain-containing protein [Marinilabiliaceae bacterium]|nr:T9SS type A sorting domain-containing protein [Marinilabiliaceae bacterium]
MRRKLFFITFFIKRTFFIFALIGFVALTSIATSQEYDPLAVQRINDLIENNGLNAPPDSPGSVVWGRFATWNDETPKQLIELALQGRNLTGVASFEGLTYLQEVDLRLNSLSKLDFSNCTNLHTLLCFNNSLTEIDLTGTDSLTTFLAHNQSPPLMMVENEGGNYIYNIFLNNPVFGNNAISYSDGILTSNDNAVNSTTFSTQSNKIGFDISGIMYLYYAEESYDPLAVERINDLIANNGLNATTDMPETWSFVSWNNETPKQLIRLQFFNSYNLEGAASFAGLTKLQVALCDHKFLCKLDFSNCSNLQALDLVANHLTELDLTGTDNLIYFFGNGQNPTFTLTQDGNEYTFAIPLNNPTFGNSAIRYENGFLISNDDTVTQTTFTVETGKPGLQLSGTMRLYYYYGETYDPLAVQRINDLIANNGLNAIPDEPWTWGNFAYWNDETPKNITTLLLGNESIHGIATFEGLTSLQYLSCINNEGLFGLDLTNCAGLKSVHCSYCLLGYNSISDLYLTGCIGLQSLTCWSNMLKQLDLTHCTELQDLQCEYNQLVELFLKTNNTNLHTLYCWDNKLSQLELNGMDNLIRYYGYAQFVQLTLTGYDTNYTLEIPLNNPTFGNSAISYENGILKSSDSSVTSTTFVTQTGKPGFTLSGTMYFTYLDVEIYSISGQVTCDGNPLAGVAITTTIGISDVTNEMGEYTLIVPENSTITITPTLQGYRFEPEQISLEDITEDITDQDFVAFDLSGISENILSSTFTIYPNPATGSVTISGVGLSRVEIYDIQGRKFAEYSDLKGTLFIDDLKKYESGVYVLKIWSEDGGLVVERLVVGFSE